MAKKKKPRTFSAVNEVKAMARDRIGSPPMARVVPDRKKKRKAVEKHRPTLAKLLENH
ncbi:MAG: hypothetical protein JOY93_04960 [Acidobacteriales bacterium]|nr:hypothetical protein [Terriglobales bacterium]